MPKTNAKGTDNRKIFLMNGPSAMAWKSEAPWRRVANAESRRTEAHWRRWGRGVPCPVDNECERRRKRIFGANGP